MHFAFLHLMLTFNDFPSEFKVTDKVKIKKKVLMVLLHLVYGGDKTMERESFFSFCHYDQIKHV